MCGQYFSTISGCNPTAETRVADPGSESLDPDSTFDPVPTSNILCPRNNPFYIVTNFIKWVTSFWTHRNQNIIYGFESGYGFKWSKRPDMDMSVLRYWVWI